VTDPELARTIAADAGLPQAAASFLVGETVAEVEASASALAKLLAGRVEEEATIAQTADPITRSIEAKSRKHDGLLRALHGQPAQARDERGRFSGAAGGFDGGARESFPEKGDPEREHGHLLGQMASISRTFGFGS
jgi:hypothetical protein